MPVRVSCPDCAASLKAPDAARGRALKCPKCGGRIKVPAGGGDPGDGRPAAAPRRRKAAPAAGGAGLLANIDLSRAEDRHSEICPKCGVEVSDEDIECSKCGADLVTGGAGASQRRKAKFKDRGEDPSVFYSTAAGDAWRFMTKNVGTALRLSGLTLFGAVLAYGCWVMVAYCAYTPPKMFWALFAVTGTLIVPGAVWVLQEATIDLTLEKKNNLKRFRFDALLCASRAPRIVAWSAVVLWPLTFVCVLAGVAVWLLELPWFLVALPLALQVGLTALCWPAGLAHSVMPVSGPAWSMTTVLKGTFANLGPVLYWLVLAFAAYLPTLLILGGAAAFSGTGIVRLADDMATNNARYQAAYEAESTVAEGELIALDWWPLLAPGLALIPAAFLFAFGTVFMVRPVGLIARMFRPSLGLITIAKEKKYVSRLKRNEFGEIVQERENDGLTWGGVLLANGVIAALGMATGTILGTTGVVNGGFGGGFPVGLYYAAAASEIIAFFILLGIAFREETMWGVGILVSSFFGCVPVSLIFIIMHWSETKHVFVWNLLAVLMAFIAVGAALGFGTLDELLASLPSSWRE